MTGERRATIGYAAPFAAYVGFLALERAIGMQAPFSYVLRFLVTLAAIAIFSREFIPWTPSRPLLSMVLGAAVFVIWIGPDWWFGPGYRHFWLFENPLTGFAASSLAQAVRQNGFLAVRIVGATLLVPIAEELFWRGWMMRWIIHTDFLKVPIGRYAPAAFWITAVLFASEHGPYWEVGLIAGVLYNLLAVRTGNLADCILAHAVTNALLAFYVVATGQWQYWL